MNNKLMNLLRKNETISILLCILGIVLLSVTSPYFLQKANIESLQTAVAPYAIMAIGMMFLLISGTFDMSVGSVMCLGGLVSAMSLTAGNSTFVSFILGILSGTLVGVINGVLVEYAGINALIATIGTQYIAKGFCEVTLVGRGKGGYTDFPDSFCQIGRGMVGGVYVMVWVMFVLMILAQLYLSRSPGGRRLYFIGGNYKASRLVGIKVKRTRLAAFMLSGTLSALAGVLVTARAGVANRYTGEGAHLDIIIACIIGGGSLAGGQGSIVGAFAGMLFMKLMSNAFNLYNIGPQWQDIIVGVILLIVLAVDGYSTIQKNKKLGKI